MSLLLDYHGSTESAPPPYAPSTRSHLQDLGLPLSLSDVPHRYYPMPSRMEGHNGQPNSLFSPESSQSTAATSDVFPDQSQNDRENPADSTLPLVMSTTHDSLLPSYTTGARITPNPNFFTSNNRSFSTNFSSSSNNGISDSNAVLSALTLQITNPPPFPRSHYDIGDIIQGTIMFAPWKKGADNKQAITSVMVVLQGLEVSMANGGVATHRTFRLAYHVVPDMAMPPEGIVAAGYVYSFPFSVQVPEVRQENDSGCSCKFEPSSSSTDIQQQGASTSGGGTGESSDTKVVAGQNDGEDTNGNQPVTAGKHRTLPPTFPGGTAGNTMDAAHIRYQLCAMVRGPQYNTTTRETKITTVCRSVQDIPVMPSYRTAVTTAVPNINENPNDPRSYLHAHHPPVRANLEVKLSRSKIFKSSISISSKRPPSTGTLHVAMSGQPINLALDFAQSKLILLDLEFVSDDDSISSAENMTLGGAGAGAGLQIQIQRVSFKLLARTLFTASRKGLSLGEARATKPAAIKTMLQTFPLSRVDISSNSSNGGCTWTRQPQQQRRQQPGAQSRTAAATTFKSSLQIPLSWDPLAASAAGIAIAPAFESCTIQRDYQFAVYVHVVGVKAPVKVVVPANVVASFRPRSFMVI